MVDISGKRGKILGIVLIACLLVSGLLIGSATLFQNVSEKPLYQAEEKIKKGKQEVITEESLSYIPGSATSVYTVAPDGVEEAKKWWKTYQLLAKYRMDLPLDVSPVAEDIKQMTLVQTPDEESFDENVSVIIEVKDEEQAEGVRDHLAFNNPVPNTSHVAQNGNLVYIALPDNLEEVQSVVEGEGNSISNNSDFVEDTKGAKDSIFWFDLSGFFDNILSEGLEEEYPDFMGNLRGSLMGFQDDTRWVGTSENHGESWVGKFSSGGYDAEVQSANDFEAKALEEITYFTEDGGEGIKGDPTGGEEDNGSGSDEGAEDNADNPEGNSEEETPEGGDGQSVFGGEYETGPSVTAMDHVSVLTKAEEEPADGEEAPSDPELENENVNENGTVVTGGVMDWTSGEYITPSEDEALDYFDTVIMFSPNGLISSMTGAGISSTNIHLYTLKIKETEMEVSTRFFSEDPKNEHIAENYEAIETN